MKRQTVYIYIVIFVVQTLTYGQQALDLKNDNYKLTVLPDQRIAVSSVSGKLNTTYFSPKFKVIYSDKNPNALVTSLSPIFTFPKSKVEAKRYNCHTISMTNIITAAKLGKNANHLSFFADSVRDQDSDKSCPYFIYTIFANYNLLSSYHPSSIASFALQRYNTADNETYIFVGSGTSCF